MTNAPPKISMLIWTYNRANEVERSIESVLNQTFQDFELILVDNGSTDHTPRVLEKYREHPRVRLFRLEKNRGVIGGMNFALDQIRGEWFATLGDHDEILPHAFETLINVTKEIDPSINAVTANAVSSTTGEFCGTGLDHDQYLPIDIIIQKTGGDFFGITKTNLLQGKRLNENLLGNANSFWYQIDAIANRYYVHQGLKIFNTEEGENVSTALKSMDLDIKSDRYKELIREDFFWQVLREHNELRYEALCLRGYFFSKANHFQPGEKFYSQRLFQRSTSLKYKLPSFLIRLFPASVLRILFRFIGGTTVGHRLSHLLVKPFGSIR